MGLIEFSLLNGFQRDFPLVERPYARLAEALGISETELLETLGRLAADGRLGRVGAIFAPGRIGASTLAALAVPPEELERVGALVSRYREVNHNYEREHVCNLWFVAAAENEERLEGVLQEIARLCACPLVTAPLIEEYRIDLGFDLAAGPAVAARLRSYLAERLVLSREERAIARVVQAGLPLEPRPYAAVAREAGTTQAQVLATLERWVEDRTIRRFGLIVRHRELGYLANAMAVWAVPDSEVTAVGTRLAREPGVTLAYRRRPCLPDWPYNLYCMVHGRERAAVELRLARIGAELGLERYPHAVLFSRRRFKQTGARHLAPEPAVAHG